MKSILLAMLLTLAVDQGPALAQQTQINPALSIDRLLNEGYDIKAASSSGQQQFVYLQGVDSSGKKKAYACQLQFGANGGFQGCLALP